MGKKKRHARKRKKGRGIRMTPVRDARYNIRRKFDNAPAEKSTTARAKKQNVQQRQRQELQNHKSNQTRNNTRPLHITSHFPHIPPPCARTYIQPTRLRLSTNATAPKQPPPTITITCFLIMSFGSVNNHRKCLPRKTQLAATTGTVP